MYRILKIVETTQVLLDKTQKHGYHLRSLSPSETKLEGLYERTRKLNVREAKVDIQEVKETTKSVVPQFEDRREDTTSAPRQNSERRISFTLA